MNWRNQLHRAKIAFRQNRLGQAVQLIRSQSLHRYRNGRKLIAELIEALCQRASRSVVAGNFGGAWNLLSAATSIATDHQKPKVSLQRQGLVELTRAQAEILLESGRVAQAHDLLNELWRRRIKDSQAEELTRLARRLSEAERLATNGNFEEARRQCEQARNMRPTWTFLNHRIAELEQQKESAKRLTRQLRQEILNSNWSRASDVSGRLLKIAPQHQVARDALIRSQKKQSHQSESPSVQLANPGPAGKLITWCKVKASSIGHSKLETGKSEYSVLIPRGQRRLCFGWTGLVVFSFAREIAQWWDRRSSGREWRFLSRQT